MRVSTPDGLVELPEKVHPNPLVWPVCNICHTTYVLKRVISMSKGWTWLWVRDCDKPRSTCKNGQGVMCDDEGALPEGGR